MTEKQAAGTGVRAPRPCENCGEPAGPHYCPHCGQELASRRGPLFDVLRELLSDWISLDSRLLRSLRTLVRPGRLSELYLAGRRAPFLRPFRLYLLASLVLFSTILTLETPDPANYELFIAGERIGAKPEGTVRRSLSFWDPDSLFDRVLLGIYGDQVDRLKELPKEEIVLRLFRGWRRMLPLALIVFVPFLALGLKLLYHPFRATTRKRAVHTLYIDHLIFSLHYQTGLFFSMATVWLVTGIAGIEFPRSALAYVGVFIAMILIYLPLALRHFYRESRLRTTIKTFIVLFVYSQLLGSMLSISALIALWRP